MCIKAFRTQTATKPERIKRVRGGSLSRSMGELNLNKRFYREIVGWKHLSHPNVLPFLGVSESLFPFSIISPWLQNGNILEYTRRHWRVDRLRPVSDHRDLPG